MNIVERVKIIALEQIKDTEYSLYDVEYTKEGSDYFLRIYFDKNGTLSLDDCVLLSEKMAEELDKEDFISEQYYLEVSSPGIERELRNIDEISDSIGKYVYLKTYEKINGQKEFYGDLLSLVDNKLQIEYKDKARKKQIEIEYEKIAKIRLAVKF
ncbi:ribosome maturation factor RimP [Gemelliphila palaticanis]|uniref:Ribosome maturation factor RimP n=1 Tax=Gemelliphila palaticanis TaxID=81950 RepID=A0ABX2T080_9BACL|nr:ribosome maturation factor RimP [Gemella palaticanis]MBF0715833.1 ribosome maturation factor RimP [Gemella palaticanis]NYS47763.1 ribosome maturation factor RimP [Gemella palaticanis]